MIIYEKLPFPKSKIWITSDTHAYHSNICRGTSTWESEHGQSVRDFDDSLQMTDELVNQINKNVKEDDLLIHLGDWSFGGQNKISEFRSRIVCKNIYLVYGNHDHNIINNSEFQSQFSRTDHVMYLRSENLKFFVSHYPHYVYHQGHHDVIHLYGHTHGSIEHVVKGKMMDVGVDNIFKLKGEYRPINLTEIEEIMNKKDSYLPDHHQKNTN